MFQKLHNTFFFFLLAISFTLAVPAPQTVPSGIWNNVIPGELFNPSTPREYLRNGVFFGGARNSLAADSQLQQVYQWGLKTHDYQFLNRSQKRLDESQFYPPSTHSFDWDDDAYSIYHTCVSGNEKEVEGLNNDCDKQKCQKTYMTSAVWGNLQGMDWKKDGVLYFSCGTISVVNSDACYQNFPHACDIHAYGNDVTLFRADQIRQGNFAEFGAFSPKSRAQLIQETRDYAQKTHQSITVPH